MIDRIDNAIDKTIDEVKLWKKRLELTGFRVNEEALDTVFEALNFYREAYKHVETPEDEDQTYIS